jgi:signal transduction histidine kinase
MEWQQTPYTFPLIITGIITFAAAAYAFRQRHVPGASDMFAMLLAVTAWVLLYTLELNAVNLADKLFWVKIEYIGIIYVPVGYTLFALNYVGDFQRIKKPRLFTAALFGIPIITLLLNWTNSQHELIYRTTTLTFDRGLSYLVVEHGIGFWVYISYIYLLLLSSSIILLRKVVATPERYRGQIILMILGSLFPWVANVVYITKNNPFAYLDLTPFAFAAMALCFAWALFRYSFLDIVPVARDMVIEKLAEGVIVIDGQNRVIDMNETAVSLLQKNKKKVLGKPLAFDTPQCRSLKTLLEKQQSTQIELVIDNAYYEASLILLEGLSSRANGRLITLHNITQRKNSELMLQRAKETAEAADQAKTNFLTNMSHEIRTPLNAVVGMTEMLRQTSLNPNQHEMLEIVAQSSQDLMLLINNILDFSRLEAGTLTLNQQSFDLIDCIEASLENLSQTAKEKQLNLSYQIEPKTPT